VVDINLKRVKHLVQRAQQAQQIHMRTYKVRLNVKRVANVHQDNDETIVKVEILVNV
jgi:hypothetical protein